jgi:hypothetical protein
MNTLTKNQKWFDLIFFAFLFAGSLLLAGNFAFKDGKQTPPGIFFSDKSHYYIYLPATFIYSWDVQKFPYHQDTVYQGFVLDYKTNKVVIKVTSGVAILCAPFFLATHGIAMIIGVNPDGFNDFYVKAAIVPPVCYFILGLWFLFLFLQHYFKRWLAYLTLIVIALGTNLYYYGLVEGWMSHIFSFFLFSFVLYQLKRFLDEGMAPFGRFLVIAIAISLAVLIRPTNIFLLLWLILLDAATLKDIWKRILFFLRPAYFLSFLLTGILIFVPQFIYWYYLSGKFLYFSYPGEGFFYWKNPMIFEVWFAQLNGLFVYNPLVFFMVAGIVYMIVKKIPNGWFLLFFFLLNSYVIGSWHAWFFGGSFGSRPFAEFFALFALSLAYFLSMIFSLKNLFLRSILLLLLFFCTLYNQRMIYNPRWNTSSTWAWDDFRDYLHKNNILHFEKSSYLHIEDYENISFDQTVGQTLYNMHSPTKACIVLRNYEFACHYEHPLGRFLDHDITRISVHCWVDPFLRDNCGALLVCLVENEKHKSFLYKAVPVDKPGSRSCRWGEVSTEIALEPWMNDSGYKFRCYLWNPRKTTFLVDDFEVRFE